MKYILTLALLIMVGCNQSNGLAGEKIQRLAAAYLQQELYADASTAYWKLILEDKVADDKKAKILYKIGNLHIDHTKDYSEALKAFTAIQIFNPNEKFGGKLDQKIVQCLENLGRSVDAKQQISKSVSLNDAGADQASVIAVVDGKQITLEEVENMYGKLPGDVNQKRQLVQSYVGSILVAKAARRKGLDKDPEVLKQTALMKDQILIQANLQEQFKDLKPDPLDLENFFNANKANYGDSTVKFEDVKDKVVANYMQQKQASMVNTYIQDLLRAENVKLHLEKIK